MNDWEILERDIRRRTRLFHWMIDGSGIHCIPLRCFRYLTPERIEELYNINFGE